MVERCESRRRKIEKYELSNGGELKKMTKDDDGVRVIHSLCELNKFNKFVTFSLPFVCNVHSSNQNTLVLSLHCFVLHSKVTNVVNRYLKPNECRPVKSRNNKITEKNNNNNRRPSACRRQQMNTT